MAKGKKCPKCGNYTMHEKRPNYWYCSSCHATTFGFGNGRFIFVQI